MTRSVVGLYLITLGVTSIFTFIGVANGVVPGYRALWNLRHATVGVYSVETTTLRRETDLSETRQRRGTEFSIQDRYETRRNYTFDKPSTCIRNSLYAEASACAQPVVEIRLSLALALSTLLIGAGVALQAK